MLQVGLEKSPHYRGQLSEYLKDNPTSKVRMGAVTCYKLTVPHWQAGLPGDKQGFNTGVLLLNLDRSAPSSVQQGGVYRVQDAG